MVTPKTNREKIEEKFNLINKDKKPEQILEESFEHTKNNLGKERTQRNKEQSAKILAIRSMYNVCYPKPSSRIKK